MRNHRNPWAQKKRKKKKKKQTLKPIRTALASKSQSRKKTKENVEDEEEEEEEEEEEKEEEEEDKNGAKKNSVRHRPPAKLGNGPSSGFIGLFIGYSRFYWVFTGFYWVLPSFTGFWRRKKNSVTKIKTSASFLTSLFFKGHSMWCHDMFTIKKKTR